MRKVSIPKVSLNYIFLSPFREHKKQTLPKFKGKFADNSTANGWWYKANSPNGPKISLAAHVDEETKNFELYELSETPFFDNNNDLENIAATGNYGNVADMRNMFSNCSKLTSLDLSNFDTSSVTNMSSMFGYCRGLTSLNLSGWDTSKVTNMSWMFDGCSKLTSLDVSNFDTSNVISMSGVFRSCSNLTSLNLSGWDTSKMTSMSWMFHNCSKLTSLDVSNFNTSSVANMNSMFGSCSNLTSLNLSGWNLSKVTDMGSMFSWCSNLTTITGPITGISTSIDLKYSPLIHDSAMVFLNGLNTVTGTKTITFKSTTYETLTEVEIAAATAKGWTVASA